MMLDISYYLSENVHFLISFYCLYNEFEMIFRCIKFCGFIFEFLISNKYPLKFVLTAFQILLTSTYFKKHLVTDMYIFSFKFLFMSQRVCFDYMLLKK